MLAESFLAQVTGNRNRFAPRTTDQIDSLLRIRLLRGVIVDRDIGAFARICDRGPTTHSAIAAGHERFAPLQAAGTFVALFAMVRPRVHLACQAGPGLR